MSELSETAAIAQADDDPQSESRVWLGEISLAGRTYKPWHTRGSRVIRRYKDENNDREMIQNTRGRKMAMLWSNVETIKPALYSQTPVPNISRRNKDADPVGRWASIILERAVVNSLATQDFDKTMRDCVQDLLLPGMGIAIEEYAAEIEGEGTDETVSNQQTVTRYIHFKDWLTNPARIWTEVWWFAYAAYLTREEVAKKFGEEIGKAIALDHKQRDDKGRFTGKDARATIWTIWSKRHKKVIQVSPGYPDKVLSETDPPIKFNGFFPCPRPIQATVANDTIIPVPDFALYQDQADEIDLLTNKIYKLSESLRVRGIYAADLDSVKRLLSDAGDTELIPVENWAMVMERGGMDKSISWFPLKDIAQALIWTTEAREKAKEALYEVTGLSDIIRGSTDAQETMGAQKLKSQWGSLRIRDRRRDIERFGRDLVRLKAEVISEHFSQETLQQMSGVKLLTDQQKQMVTMAQQMMQRWEQQAQAAQQAGMQPPPPPSIPQPTPEMLKAMQEPSWDQVMALLRNDKLRGFSIDIETDSTVEPDQQAEQQKAVQFAEAVAQLLTVSGPILTAQPAAAPMLGELLMLVVRRFKAGETVETAIEGFVAAVQQQPKGPDPKMQAEQAKTQAVQIKSQAEGVKAQAGIQTSMIKADAEKTKAELGIVQAVAAHHTKMAEHQADMAVAEIEANKPNGAQP